MTRDTLRSTPDINREYSINYERAVLYTALSTLLTRTIFFLYRGREMMRKLQIHETTKFA